MDMSSGSCLRPETWEMTESVLPVNSTEEFPESSLLKSRSPKLSLCSNPQSLEQCCPICHISCTISREAHKCYQGLLENPDYASERLAYMLVPSVRHMREGRYSALLWMDGSRTYSTIPHVTKYFDSAGHCAPEHSIEVEDSIREGAPI